MPRMQWRDLKFQGDASRSRQIFSHCEIPGHRSMSDIKDTNMKNVIKMNVTFGVNSRLCVLGEHMSGGQGNVVMMKFLPLCVTIILKVKQLLFQVTGKTTGGLQHPLLGCRRVERYKPNTDERECIMALELH